MTVYYQYRGHIFQVPNITESYMATVSYVDNDDCGSSFKEQKIHVQADNLEDASRLAVSQVEPQKMPRLQSINFRVYQ